MKTIENCPDRGAMAKAAVTLGCMPGAAYGALLNPLYYVLLWWHCFRGTEPGKDPDWRKMPIGGLMLTRRWHIIVGFIGSLAFNLALWAAFIATASVAFATPAAALPFLGGSIGVLAPQFGLAASIPVVGAVVVGAGVVGLAGYGLYQACKSDTPKKREDGE